MKEEHKALWGGRFEEGVEYKTQVFGASLPVDKNMYAEDIKGSIAHAKMLAKGGVISKEDAEKIENGLLNIKKEIEDGNFVFDINDEDIHMAIESQLTEEIGDAGKRLHTGRSRNDQVVCDTRLYAKRLAKELMETNITLRDVLYNKSLEYNEAIMPGYTHMQHAQPVLFAHHIMAYFWMFTRDFTRLKNAYDSADVNPLGSAALAGTTYTIDRMETTKTLEFKDVSLNSLDAVSDRDFLLDLDYACAVSMMHLSRLSEEIILWATSEFNFITLSDSYSTGSSIMPQKKNPDFAELIRGKSGRVYGDLMGLLTMMKGLPLAYNKDTQEDKEGVIDAVKTLNDCMEIMAGIIDTLKINEGSMIDSAKKGFMAATDIADYLAKKGVPFREAHAIVGNLVLLCEKRNCDLEDLSLEDFKAASAIFEEDITKSLDLVSIVKARNTIGGTGNDAVKYQMDKAKELLDNQKETF